MSWDFIKITYPIAGKDHRCAECSRVILKGERHAYTAGKTEGIFEDYRLCVECMDLAQAYCTLIDEEGWGLGQLRVQLAENDILPEGYSIFLMLAERKRSFENVRFRNHSIRERALADVLAERKRQIEVEGCDETLDDGHVDGSLAITAAAFIGFGLSPFSVEWHDLDPAKHDRRQQLVIGAALAIAEIERLDRAAINSQGA